MREDTEKYLTEGVKKLENFDCGDNSCRFAKNKSGMRTNGGCRCLNNLPLQLRIGLIKLYMETQDENNKRVPS